MFSSLYAILNLFGYTQATSASLVYICTPNVWFLKFYGCVVDFLAWFCNRSLDPVTCSTEANHMSGLTEFHTDAESDIFGDNV